MSAKDTKEIEDCSIMLSRVSNHLKMGIVGLPNVGKSTLYNILTKQQVSAENYPFCTIEPNKDMFYILLLYLSIHADFIFFDVYLT